MSSSTARKVHDPTKGMKDLGFDNDQHRQDLFDRIHSADVESQILRDVLDRLQAGGIASEILRHDDGSFVINTLEQYSFPWVYPQYKCMTWIKMSHDDYTLLIDDTIIGSDAVSHFTINGKKQALMARLRSFANGFFIKQMICPTCVICRKRPTKHLIGNQEMIDSQKHVMCFRDLFARPVCGKQLCILIALKPVINYTALTGIASNRNMLTCDRCLSFLSEIMTLCANCNCVAYCSETCRLAHRGLHRTHCNAVVKRCRGREKTCARCHMTGFRFASCSRCERVHYCSYFCHHANWPTHKVVCDWKVSQEHIRNRGILNRGILNNIPKAEVTVIEGPTSTSLDTICLQLNVGLHLGDAAVAEHMLQMLHNM